MTRRFVPAGLMFSMKEKIQRYLQWKGTYASRASVNYKLWLDRFVEICGEKEVEKYDISDYTKYKLWLEGKFSPYSIQFATVVIKNFFQFLRDQDIKCLCPNFIRIKRINAKSHRAISEEEYQKVITLVPVNEFRQLRDSIIIRMLWDTGVRVSELCDMDIQQIDEKKRSATIQTKKTGKLRIIVWSEETHYYLMKYMPIRLELHNINQASALFVGWECGKGWSTRLSTRTVQRVVRNYVSKAGIKERITPHSFRHGWAHKRRDQNAPLAFIQRGLGHNNPISTFIYEQYNDNEFLNSAYSFF